MNDQENKYMLRDEVLKVLGISVTHLNNLRNKGLIRSAQYMHKGIHRYFREDVEKLLHAK